MRATFRGATRVMMMNAVVLLRPCSGLVRPAFLRRAALARAGGVPGLAARSWASSAPAAAAASSAEPESAAAAAAAAVGVPAGGDTLLFGEADARRSFTDLGLSAPLVGALSNANMVGATAIQVLTRVLRGSQGASGQEARVRACADMAVQAAARASF